MHRLAPLLLTLLFACAPGDDDDTDDTDGTDADTDADTGPDAGPCPAYAGLRRAGASWTWAYSAAAEQELGVSGTWTTRILSIDGADVRLESDGTNESASYDAYAWQTATHYRCDAEGAWLLDLQTSWSMVVGAETYEGEAFTSYSDPYLTLAAGLAEGATWSGTASGTTSAAGVDTPFSFTYAFEVGAPEEVSVPAGAFDTLPVQATIDGQPSTSWADRDVGSVKGTYVELVSYDP